MRACISVVGAHRAGIGELYDIDRDGSLDFFFLFDAYAWGVVLDVLKTSGDLECKSELPKGGGSFCAPLGLDQAALTADFRAVEGGTRIAFAVGDIYNHTTESDADWALFRLSHDTKRKWLVDAVKVHGAYSYAGTRFISDNQVLVSQIDTTKRSSRPILLNYDDANWRQCPNDHEGMFASFAPNGPTSTSMEKRYDAPGEGCRPLQLAGDVPGPVTNVTTADDEQESLKFFVAPDSNTIYVCDGGAEVLVTHASRAADSWTVATTGFGVPHTVLRQSTE